MIKGTINSWHKIVSTKNTAELNDLVGDSAVFYSPVVYTPQKGKKMTVQYLSAALHVFGNETFHYVREVLDRDNAVLEFEVDIEGIAVNGVDIIKCDDAGKIVEFKVMIRPLKGVNIIHQKMMEMLAAS
ncbi:MAG: nuclear transport factor 2 family protein [Cellvibrionaceae bacterium]